jgi:hypothetical protein
VEGHDAFLETSAMTPGDLAAEISDSRDLLAPVRAYAATDPATLGATVDRYLGELATGLWMAADVSAQRTRVV